MADRKERYEILFENIDHKMDIVLEGYTEMNRKFDEAREERQIIRDEQTHKIEFVSSDLNRKIDETKEGLKETRNELKETREELGKKIDRVGERIEDHEVRIAVLERKAEVRG